MTRMKTSLLIFLFLINAVFCFAQVYNNETENQTGITIVAPSGNKVAEGKFKLGPGMEVIKFGEVNIVAPKGTRVQKEGSQIVYEDIGEYIGRRFYEIEKHLEQIEVKQEGLEIEIGQLKETLEDIRKSSLSSKEKTTQDKE